MLLTSVSLLRCPKAIEEIACASKIRLLHSKEKKGTDIIFGSLICEQCKNTFPILAGVAILVDDVEQYLQVHAKGVSMLVKDNQIPEPYIESFLFAKSEIETGFIEEDLESQRINALYFMNHYLKVKTRSGKPWWRPSTGAFSKEINHLIQTHWDHGPFSKIADWTKSYKNQNIIELGCGVGGLAQVFSKTARNYLGVDSSFASIALARHIFLQTKYPLSIQIPQDLFHGPLTGKISFPLKKRKNKNIDFVVGELQNLPVVKGEFDLSVALNAIDMIENPSDLPRLQFELLKENGVAIQSCPYIWQNMVSAALRKSVPKKISSSSAAVEYLYEKSGFTIFKKIDHLPWLFLKHFRQIEMYSVHLFAAKKNKIRRK